MGGYFQPSLRVNVDITLPGKFNQVTLSIQHLDMALASGSVFSKTLQTITTTKLDELARQRLAFEKNYASLLQSTSTENDPLKRLFLLVDGAKVCLRVQTTPSKNGVRGRVVAGSTVNTHLETDLNNLDRFLEQARYDSSVSPKVLDNWEALIRQYLSIQSTKYQYADLYGKLVTEWLASEKGTSADGDVEMGESFEELPGAKKMDSRAAWEKVVFDPARGFRRRLGQAQEPRQPGLLRADGPRPPRGHSRAPCCRRRTACRLPRRSRTARR